MLQSFARRSSYFNVDLSRRTPHTRREPPPPDTATDRREGLDRTTNAQAATTLRTLLLSSWPLVLRRGHRPGQRREEAGEGQTQDRHHHPRDQLVLGIELPVLGLDGFLDLLPQFRCQLPDGILQILTRVPLLLAGIIEHTDQPLDAVLRILDEQIHLGATGVVFPAVFHQVSFTATITSASYLFALDVTMRH